MLTPQMTFALAPSKLLKVKRPAEETPVGTLLYEHTGKAIFYSLLHEKSTYQNSKEKEFSTDLDTLREASTKRPRVSAIPIRTTLSSLALDESEGEEEDPLTSGYVVDYYLLNDGDVDSMCIDTESIAIVSFDKVEFASDEEDENVQEDDQDSNAEDYYKNEYPDEDDDFYSDEEEDDDDEDDYSSYRRNGNEKDFFQDSGDEDDY